jgi:hypothetical protein
MKIWFLSSVSKQCFQLRKTFLSLDWPFNLETFPSLNDPADDEGDEKDNDRHRPHGVTQLHHLGKLSSC